MVPLRPKEGMEWGCGSPLPALDQRQLPNI